MRLCVRVFGRMCCERPFFLVDLSLWMHLLLSQLAATTVFCSCFHLRPQIFSFLATPFGLLPE